MRASTWIHWVCLVQWLVARAEGHGDATCMLQHKAIHVFGGFVYSLNVLF